jgi:alkyl sulfatase BDS1-like metallo-beta-lactamase superfamily hydrolase
VVDTLTSRETAAAAMAFARQHLGDKPVSAVIFTHSHVDHFGGALGVIAADEAKARGVPAVDQPTQEITLDGLRFVFHDVPGSEAPAEFTFYLPELQAFGGAELMSHTLHNPYTLRGAKVRDALDYVLHMHYGVLHHRQAPPAGNAHATLQLTKPFSLQMLTGGAGAKDLLLSDQTKIQGSRIDLGRFFALLDKAPGNFPIVTR